jgi:DNA-binding NarL/FixJ family response regulator
MQIVRAVRPSAPMIIVSNALDERGLVACMRAGADDIVQCSEGNGHGIAENISAALQLRRPLQRLTGRQLEVLRLVSEGLTTPQIAQRLNLSVKTIETHRSEVMKRLGVHDVVSLVRYAVRVGLVPIHS